MIPINFTDEEAIAQVKRQVTDSPYLVDPEDIEAVLIRFEKLLHDYESSKDA